MTDIKTLYKKKMTIARGQLGDTNMVDTNVKPPTKSITEALTNPTKPSKTSKSTLEPKQDKPDKLDKVDKVKDEVTKLKSSKSTELKDLLQNQVCHEFDNERLYMSMSLWCAEKGYTETAKFFSEHSLEERRHGMDFINFMVIRKMNVQPPCTKEVQREFDDLKSLLQAALEREYETSTLIREIHKEALKTSDLALTIAGKYLNEQVEEEQLFESLLNLHKLCNDSDIDFEMTVNKIKSKDKYKIGSL